MHSVPEGKTVKNGFVLLSLLLLGTACDPKPSSPDTLVKEGYDQAEMDAAIARAKSQVEVFLKELAKPTGEDHAVKAPITDANGTEHFWLTELTYNNGEFQGTINNEPGIVKNVKIGQKYKIKKADISDWMYMKNGKMHGNYTMRPLLKTLAPDEAAKLKLLLAEP